MGSEIVLSWPAAIALVGVAMTITAGVLKMFSMGRTTVTTASLQDATTRLANRVTNSEQKIIALETSVDKTVSSQITDLKEGMRRMEDKMDTLVKEVITALGALAK